MIAAPYNPLQSGDITGLGMLGDPREYLATLGSNPPGGLAGDVNGDANRSVFLSDKIMDILEQRRGKERMVARSRIRQFEQEGWVIQGE